MNKWREEVIEEMLASFNYDYEMGGNAVYL